MKKKTIIIISVSAVVLAAIIIATTVFLNNVFRDKPAGGVTLSIESVSCKKGDIISLPVRIENNPGIMGYLLKFNYDNKVLEYTGYDNGNILSSCELNSDGQTVTFISINDRDITEDGVLVYLKFRVSSDTAEKSTKVTIECDENGLCNYNEEGIKATASNGIIKIE